MAVLTDMTKAKISNRLIIAGLLCGFVFRISGEGAAGLLAYLIHISIPVILLYLFFQMRALGAGDIKLFSVTGAFLTTEQLLTVMATAFFAGAVQGICRLLYDRLKKGGNSGHVTKIHFSAAILAAYLISVWRWTFG